MGSQEEAAALRLRGTRASSPGAAGRRSTDVANKTVEEAELLKHVEEEQEFGGPVGVVFVMISSHVLIFAMTASLYGTNAAQFVPTATSTAWFVTYHFSQTVFARYMPGVYVPGQTGMGYLCNAYSTLYATVAINAVLHLSGVFDMTTIVKQFPAFLTTAVILANIYAVITHLSFAKGPQVFSIYDFFMGIGVHPRVGKMVDVKMVAETRVSWTLLFLITVACFIECYRRLQSLLNPVLFMVLAHGLYANACAKGEHFIPYTWDITTEKFGWMLCWWNLAGVPLLYCYQSLFLLKHSWSGLVLPTTPALYYTAITILLLIAYWIWDEANYHKCYFKMERRGEIVKRNLFPTFRHVENPKYIKCDVGVLLIDGWYKYARKIHYTADTSMALLWGLSCGFSSLLPYVYVGFFVCMITHRASRDEAKCRQKYGATWDKYLNEVPYRFIPYVY